MSVPAVAGSGWVEFRAARDSAIARLGGRVLEIGAGEGANFAHLTDGVTWIGLEPSARRRRRLAEAARHHGHSEPPLHARAERIPLPDVSVDAVLGTVVLCSVRDQARALSEILRVLRPGGRVVLAEHVAAPRRTFVRAAQGAARPFTRLFDHGCDPTRDTVLAVRRSGLNIDQSTEFSIPVLGRLSMPFVVIEARHVG